MITILVLYRASRRALFETAWSVLGTYQSIRSAERILCCDGVCDISPANFHVIEIERRDGYYCWADAMERGLDAASNEIIWYLDCDRCFPEPFANEALGLIDENSVISPSLTYRCPTEHLHSAIYKSDLTQTHLESRICYPPDPLVSQIGKNPFSGNTVFHKSLYRRVGGFDPHFLGYGYADLDLYVRTHRNGYQFRFVTPPEFHLAHDAEEDPRTHALMCAYNCMLFCRRYGVEPLGMDRLFSRFLIEPSKLSAYNTLGSFLKSQQGLKPFL